MRRAILVSGMAVGVLRLAGMALGLLVTIVVGRTLGPEGLGLYGYAVIVLTLLGVPVSYGWGTLLLRRVSAAMHDQGWSEARGMILRGTQIAAAATAFAAVVLAFPLLQAGFASLDWTVLAALAAVLFLDQLSALRLAVLRGLNHPVWGQAPEMLIRPAIIVASFLAIAAVVGSAVDLRHAAWAMALGAASGAAAGAMVLRGKRPAVLSEAAPVFATRPWMASAAMLATNSGLILLNSYVDVLVLGALGTMEQVGIYRIATQVALLSGFAYTALNMIATPRFAFLRTAGDTRGLQDSAVFMARLALLGALPLPLLFYFFGERILEAVFGPAFVSARAPMFPLFAGQVVNAAVGMASSLLLMASRDAQLVRFTLGAVVVNAVLSVALVPRFGAMGAAWANMAAMIAWNVSIWIHVLRTLRVDTSVLGRFGELHR